MPVLKKILIAAMFSGLCITASAASVGEYAVVGFCHPTTILLAFLLLCSNLRQLGPYRISTLFIGLGILCLALSEYIRFFNIYVLNTQSYTPLIRFIYILPSFFFAVNETIFFHKKLTGYRRELSYIYANSFCFSVIGIILIYRMFMNVVGSITNAWQLLELIMIFFGGYVVVMCVQTFYIVGTKQIYRETLLITGAMLVYEIMDIYYIFALAIGREPDNTAMDIIYLVLEILMVMGVTIQTEKRYVFEFLKHEHNEKTIVISVIVSFVLSVIAMILVSAGILNGSDATHIIIVLVAYIIMNYLLYVSEWRKQQNEKLEQMVLIKTRELTMANLQLATAKAAAEEASKAKSEFLANMSHEIRTPINAMLGMNELILREVPDPILRKYALNIQRAGNALLTQINDILDFSKIEAGKMELVNDGYNLAMMLADIVEMIDSRAKLKGLKMVIDINEEVPHTLYGDSVRISQVIINILTNAVKYTKEGSVTFKVDYNKTDEEYIDLSVSIKDTGIGIKKEDITKLFNPFERVDERRNNTIEGTGLGMNIVRNLLAMMDSRLYVESEYGKGSTFSFSICQKVLDWEPLGSFESYIEGMSQKTLNYHSQFFAPQAKVLLVDDTEMNLMVVKGLLKNTGLCIDTALDGKQALSMSEKREYDILLIDHRMPVMDGVEMIELLRKDRYNPNSKKPCIVLTANAVAGAKNDYIAAGFDDYLFKPVSGSRLENMMLKYLPQELLQEASVIEGSKAKMDQDLVILEENGYLNVREGIEYAGSSDMYRKVLDFFRDTIDVKSNEIRRYYETEDWKNYQTKVHGLKSSAKTIGAEELSNRARALELAAKDKDYSYIIEHTGDVLAFYKSYKEKIVTVTGKRL